MKLLKKYERDSLSMPLSQQNIDVEVFNSIKNIIDIPIEELNSFIFKIEAQSE